MDGTAMQLISSANCPAANAIRAVDARDNHSYWVQKLSDGNCWMLTNLAYAGDGSTTYGDTTTLTTWSTGTSGNTGKYYYQPGGNMYTTEPTNPSTTTGAGGQYGYLYNYCATMGGQTAACQNSPTAQPNQGVNTGSGANNNVNICPKGWRLPTGGTGGEFEILNNVVNGGATNTDTGLRDIWLGVYAGLGNDNGTNQSGIQGFYRASSIIGNATGYMQFSSNYVFPAYPYSVSAGLAVRCIAN